MAEYLLEMKQIVKQFPGTLALDHVDFTLEQGEVMALIGENGAGKSTLMNVLMGMLQPDSGEMVLRGQTITNRSPYEALQKGIGMVPQELNLVSDLSIAENIFLGLHQKKGNRIDWDHMRSKAKEMLDKLEVDIDPGKKISEVSAAYQQLVSIARTLVFGSNIIILDEPTASLTLNETEHLFKNIRKLKNEGKAIIMITHHLDEVLEIADRVTIMRDGKLIRISNTPQELNLVSDLSIAENIFLGLHQKKGNRIDWDHMRSKAKEMLDKLEVDIDPGKKISEVSAAYQQLVSIARTLVFGSNIIILDEPTASLTLNETEHLFKNIRKLKNEGKAIIMITHHLDEVLEIADRVTIMRDGKLIRISNTSDLSIDDMIYYMANQKVEKSQHIVRPVSDQVFLKVIGLCRGKEFQNVDFEVKKGEIFGVAGLVGAGRTELFSCLYGLTKKDKGKVYLEGKEVEITSPNEAISYGIGLVPEERRKQGMFPILSIYENIMMPNYHKVTRMGRINFSQAREAANRHIQALRIKTPDCLTQIKNLSGGNQQKVILGRWMEKQVKLFILDEPTRGIDVRAKGEIYKLIRDMADSGITVIVISSEIEELLTLADRIMIMNGGKVKGFVVPNEDMEREDILKVALH